MQICLNIAFSYTFRQFQSLTSSKSELWDEFQHLYHTLFSDNEGYNKIEAFRRETKTKNNLMLTLITTYGVRKNMYSGSVQHEIVMEDLFER